MKKYSSYSSTVDRYQIFYVYISGKRLIAERKNERDNANKTVPYNRQKFQIFQDRLLESLLKLTS